VIFAKTVEKGHKKGEGMHPYNANPYPMRYISDPIRACFFIKIDELVTPWTWKSDDCLEGCTDVAKILEGRKYLLIL
jgi:hypothetical protein